MNRAIIAIDEQRGMATDKGIPWDLPSDRQYFRDHLQSGKVLMGYGTYLELKKPFGKQDNYVATHREEGLREGFIKVSDAEKFIRTNHDVWNIGGVGLLANTMQLLDELYVTQVQGDFQCTKFLPEFEDRFSLISKSPVHQENGVKFVFEVWQKR